MFWCFPCNPPHQNIAGHALFWLPKTFLHNLPLGGLETTEVWHWSLQNFKTWKVLNLSTNILSGRFICDLHPETLLNGFFTFFFVKVLLFITMFKVPIFWWSNCVLTHPSATLQINDEIQPVAKFSNFQIWILSRAMQYSWE